MDFEREILEPPNVRRERATRERYIKKMQKRRAENAGVPHFYREFQHFVGVFSCLLNLMFFIITLFWSKNYRGTPLCTITK